MKRDIPFKKCKVGGKQVKFLYCGFIGWPVKL